MKFLASVQSILFVVWISEIQKQLLADVLLNRCFLKFRNVHRRTQGLESEGLQFY